METSNKPQKWCRPFGTLDLLINSNICDKSLKIVQVFREIENSSHIMSFQVCDFFSLLKEIKCSSHIKRWGDFLILNNSSLFSVVNYKRVED